MTHLRWPSKLVAELGLEPNLGSLLPHPALPVTPSLSFLVQKMGAMRPTPQLF